MAIAVVVAACGSQPTMPSPIGATPTAQPAPAAAPTAEPPAPATGDPAPLAPIEPPAPASAAPTPSAEVAIGPIKVVHAKTKEPVVDILPDGGIKLIGQLALTLTTDGRLIENRSGNVLMELTADGRIRSFSTQRTWIWDGARIFDDGTAERDGKKVEIDRSGRLTGVLPIPVKVTGAKTPALARTTLFVLLAMSMPAEPPP